MINEQLGPSVSEVFGVGGDDLKQILTDVRVELDKQGLELLVLIEDFSIFQGIQGGLIDAITLISTEDAEALPDAGRDGRDHRLLRQPDAGDGVHPDVPGLRPRPARRRRGYASNRPASRLATSTPSGSAPRDLDAAHERDDELVNACEQCPVNAACHAAFGPGRRLRALPVQRCIAATERSGASPPTAPSSRVTC